MKNHGGSNSYRGAIEVSTSSILLLSHGIFHVQVMHRRPNKASMLIGTFPDFRRCQLKTRRSTAMANTDSKGTWQCVRCR